MVAVVEQESVPGDVLEAVVEEESAPEDDVDDEAVIRGGAVCIGCVEAGGIEFVGRMRTEFDGREWTGRVGRMRTEFVGRE